MAELLQVKVLIRNRINHRMIYAMELAAILPVAGSMIRAADHKSSPSLLFPSIKKPSQLPIHIAQGSPVAFHAVMGSAFQVKIVGVMDGIYI